MDWPVTYRRKIRYSDTDAQKIVFNGNYATYFDDTITDLFDLVGFEWVDHEIVLAKMEIEFRSPATIGETLVTGARVERVGRTSLTVHLESWEEATERPVATARQVQVVVSAQDFKPVPVPDALVEAIERVQGAVER